MTAEEAPMSAENDTAADINRIEGYLLWSAEQERAQHMARAFASRLPWLTPAEHADVERAYTADRLALSRAVLSQVARRAEELREEYAARYRRLRVRCVGAAVALGAVLSAVSALAAMLSARC
jgi:hypothetical protein